MAVLVYWPLMKGLLAGKIGRDQVFGPDDSRHKYPMFQGEERRKNHDLVDRLQAIAQAAGHSVAELVINWTIHQPGITAALCGAKRPDQIRECAGGSGWQLTAEQVAQIDQALARTRTGGCATAGRSFPGLRSRFCRAPFPICPCLAKHFSLPRRYDGVWFSRKRMLKWSTGERHAQVRGHNTRACVGRILDRVQHASLSCGLGDDWARKGEPVDTAGGSITGGKARESDDAIACAAARGAGQADRNDSGAESSRQCVASPER